MSMIVIWLYGHGVENCMRINWLIDKTFSCRLSISAKSVEPVGRPDGVIIATPAQSHASIALRHLNAGIYCLIEKPLATK